MAHAICKRASATRRGSTVQPVLVVTTFVALTLVLGAGYASIRAASADARRKAEAEPVIVQGVPLVQDPASADTDTIDPNAGMPLVSHGKVQDLSDQLRFAELREGVRAIEYSDIALPDYEARISKDGVARPNEEIFPPEVLELDGQEIALPGFMVPLEWTEDNRFAKRVILSPYPLNCHFGTVPRADEWIEVDATAMGGTPFIAYRVVRVTGKLELGEVYDEYGFLMSLYRIEASAVDEVK